MIAQDEITWPVPATVEQTGSRACRYCESLYKTPLDYDGPPLCEGCREDTNATRARIKRDLAGVLSQMDAVLATWEAITAQRPDLWAKLESALARRASGDVTEAQLAERWKARYSDPDRAWRVLLKGYEDRECDLAPLSAERARLEAALEVLEAL